MSTHKQALLDAETLRRLEAEAEKTLDVPVQLWRVDVRRLLELLHDDSRRRQALRVKDGLHE